VDRLGWTGWEAHDPVAAILQDASEMTVGRPRTRLTVAPRANFRRVCDSSIPGRVGNSVGTLSDVMGTFLRPANWSLTSRTATELIVAAIVPLAICVLLVSARGRSAVENAAERNLLGVSRLVATQTEQLLSDLSGRLIQLAEDERIVRLCAADPGDRAAIAELVQAQLRRVDRDDPDVGALFVSNADGIGLVGTHDHQIGQDFTFRSYWQEARSGRANVSSVLVGARSRRAGVYFAAPVRDGERIVGVAVLKLDAERLNRIVDAVDVPGGEVVISDADGIVLVHSERGKSYRSFGPLDAATLDRVDPMLAFGLDRIDDLGLPQLMAPLRSGTAGAHLHRRTNENGRDERWATGHTPIPSRAWMVSVAMPMASVDAPLSSMARQQFAIALLLAVAAGIYACIRSPVLIRPIGQLTAAAGRLAAGELDTRVPADREDEIGRLGRAFNAMVPSLREHLELRRSLAIVSATQQALLHDARIAVEGIDLCGRSRPCDETGGDYPDFIDLSEVDGGVLLAVGDVTGPGIGTSLVMASARGTLRMAIGARGDLAAAMDTLNLIVSQDSRAGSFMSLMLMRISAVDRTIEYVSAGHEPALVVDLETRSITELDNAGPALGEQPDAEHHLCRVSLSSAGAIVYIGTDGVREACNEGGERFGTERLHEFLLRNAHLSAAALASGLESALVRFSGDRRFEDNVTFLIARVSDAGTSTASPSAALKRGPGGDPE